MQADATALTADVPVIELASTASTNAEALARARQGARGPLWIRAEQQTAGRGRHGRAWASPAGNLYASLLLTDPAPQQRAAELSFVAALALHDAISQCAPAVAEALRLKWPNDLLLNDAKLAGILIEAEGGNAAPLSVVIGLGVNCRSHPTDTAYPATNLAVHGVQITPSALLDALRRTMQARLQQWQGGAAFPSIRADWIARANGFGAPIHIRTGGRNLTGLFTDVDLHGRIVVTRADGISESVSAGEVFPLGDAALPTARPPA
jgi:BirA family transcriptional regulator, biotin operon repressor / biotin---[acetyl-CoA-carboxylase] ligase